MSKKISGKQFMEAVKYAFQACPKASGNAELAHVVFIDRRVICSDGVLWLVGQLPEEGAIEAPFVATRESVDDLLLALKYGSTMARRHDADFTVDMDGNMVTVRYGETKRHAIAHELIRAQVGYVPDVFEEPVAVDAPAMQGDMPASSLKCGNVALAMEWASDAAFSWRGAGGREPVRIDVTGDNGLAATAFLLPAGREPAQLPPEEPLLKRKEDKPTGRSLLDLRLDLATKRAATIKIGEVEIDATGIDNPSRFAITGPCTHFDDQTPCVTCTTAAIAGERRRMADEAKAAAGKPAKRRKKKVDDDVDLESAEAQGEA